MRIASLIAVLVLAVTTPAFGLTLGSTGGAVLPVNSFVLDETAGANGEDFVDTAGAARPVAVTTAQSGLDAAAQLGAEAKTEATPEVSSKSHEILYYLSSVPTPVVKDLLTGAKQDEGVVRVGGRPPVAEPGTGLLVLGGLGALVRRRRRK